MTCSLPLLKIVELVHWWQSSRLGSRSFSDDNLTSDTSNRRVRFGSDAKEQLSLTDEGCASTDDMQFASVEDC